LRKERRVNKFKEYTLIGLIIPFVSTDIELSKLLLLNKASHNALNKAVIK